MTPAEIATPHTDPILRNKYKVDVAVAWSLLENINMKVNKVVGKVIPCPRFAGIKNRPINQFGEVFQ